MATAAEFQRLYMKMLKSKVKAARAASGGRKLGERERFSARFDAEREAEESQRRLGGGVVKDLTRGKKYGYIVATDKFMSNWGSGLPRRSLYAVAVKDAEEADVVERNMKKRSEMKRIRFTSRLPRVGRGDHLHVVDRKEAARFFEEPHKGGFGRPQRAPLDVPSKSTHRTRLEELQDAAANAGLYVSTYAPGDGVTRYRFHEKPASYFSDSGVHTALGLQKAWKYLQT